jgi:hydrogenase nickel incorporation protein HypB
MVRVVLKRDVLEKENRQANSNRRYFSRRGVVALNLIGSPGCGKTSLIEAAHRRLAQRLRMAVIEGDLATDKDARRLRKLKIPVVQVNTGRGCHLTPRMISSAARKLPLDRADLLIIENIGNLVCPVNFDLGEAAKVGVLSVAEGDDKPEKYPLLFREASVLLLNKIDLLPGSDFRLRAFYGAVKKINPGLRVIEVSCRSGEGTREWAEWLKSRLKTEG